MENLSINYHWNTSLQWGTERVNREKIRKTLLKIERNRNVEGKIKLANNDIIFFSKRRTEREFLPNSAPLEIKDISTLLSNSVKLSIDGSELKGAAPSAGGLYPISTYLLINRVQGINSGVYFYNPNLHSLSYLSPIKSAEAWQNAFLNQSFTKKEEYLVAFIFVLVNDVISCKYEERGYRYGLIEVGHIAQNLQIVASELGIASVPVGGFIDYDIVELLNLDPLKELPIYAVFMGALKGK